jgi:FkbM family methyltransferase
MHTLLGLRAIPFGSIFDVGANEGQFARFAREAFPQARLYCFEPTPQAHAKLAAWALADGNAVTANVALGDASGTCEINLHADHSPSSSLLDTTDTSHAVFPMTARQRKVAVRIERLDDFVASQPWPPAEEILLKLDVQGYEAPVLRGAPNLLGSARACIIEVCLDGLYQDQSTFKEVFDLIHAAGLRYAGNLNQVYGVDGHVIYLDALFVR